MVGKNITYTVRTQHDISTPEGIFKSLCDKLNITSSNTVSILIYKSKLKVMIELQVKSSLHIYFRNVNKVIDAIDYGKLQVTSGVN